MARQLKFRAWDGLRMTTSGIMFNCSTSLLEVPDGSRMNIMQFSGLKDKNYNDIYEGDIINQYSGGYGGWQGKVVFLNGSFRIETNDDFPQWINLSKYAEIIGNIYENPELLIDKK